MDRHLELRARTTRGVAWSMIGTFGGRLISLLSLAILARLLAPEDFGLLAFALVFLAYLETVGDLGTGAALVYWPGPWKDVAQLTFLANVMMGAVWVIISLTSAPLVAEFFGSPEGVPVLRTLCWVVLIKAFGNTHDALLQRDLRFRARVIPEVSLLVTKAVASVVLAVMGFGLWSLVWGQLLGQTLATVLMWTLVPWRPELRFPRQVLSPVIRYGRGIVSVNVIASVVHHVDYVIVGRMLGVAVLGIYQMAYKIPDIAITLLVRVASKVLFPALSRLREAGGDLRDIFLPALRYLSVITLPGSVCLAVVAEPLVMALFGEQWSGSAPILQAIAAYAGIRALGSFTGDILKAIGRPGLLALLGMARAALLIPLLILAARQSALAVAWMLTAIAAVSTCVNFGVASILLRSSIGELVWALWPGIASILPPSAILLLWIRISESWPPAFSLVPGLLLGLAAYVLTMRMLLPEIFRQGFSQILGRAEERGQSEASPPPLGALS